MESCIRKRIYKSLPSLSEELKKRLPEKYEKVGDILIIHLHPSLHDSMGDIGQAYKNAFQVKTVLLKGKIHGEFRVPKFTIIAGSDTTTIQKENGILYELDLSKVMFSSGNIHERIRMSQLPHHEEVVDMFSGIGYFTLPVAKFCESHVSAVEKNQDAFHFLCRNIALNKVEDLVAPCLLDCRQFQGKADRVIMGHPQAHAFLDTAFDIIDRGYLHYHEFVPEKHMGRPTRRLMTAARKAGKSLQIIDTRKIKKFSPGVWHMVFDVRIF
jgi:tRNA wybutosine-synthesizing protein 2